jgi:hypothetical protein
MASRLADQSIQFAAATRRFTLGSRERAVQFAPIGREELIWLLGSLCQIHR